MISFFLQFSNLSEIVVGGCNFLEKNSHTFIYPYFLSSLLISEKVVVSQREIYVIKFFSQRDINW